MRELLEVDISFIPRKIVSANEMLSRLARYASSMMTRASNKLGVARAVFCLGVLFYLCVSFSAAAVASDCRVCASGLIDLHGREIIPCKYKDIVDLGAGLFGAKEFELAPETKYEAPIHVFNRLGKELEVDVPDGYELINVFFVNEPVSGGILERLPAQALLEIRKGNDYRLVTLEGFAILDHYDYPLYRWRSEKYVVFVDYKSYWFYPSRPYPLWMVIIDPTTNQKFYSGPEVELLKNQLGRIRPWMPETEEVSGKDFDGNTIITHVVQDSTSFLSDGANSNGWNGEYAIVSAYARKNGREREYGITNRKRELTVIPMYSRLEYLFDNVYLAQTKKGSTAYLINGEGKPLATALPAGTYDGLYRGGILVFEQGEGVSPDQKKVSVFTRDFEPIISSAKGSLSSFYKGIAVKRLDSLDSDGEGSFDVITKDGVMGTGIRASSLSPLTGELLIKSECQKAGTVRKRH